MSFRIFALLEEVSSRRALAKKSLKHSSFLWVNGALALIFLGAMPSNYAKKT